MNALGDCAQSARSMIHGIHRRDDGEKNLRRANVTRRFVAPNVLLARLQREPVSGPAFDVVRNANESTGHVTFILVACRKKRRVRSAETERNAKALRAADRDISAEFAGR